MGDQTFEEFVRELWENETDPDEAIERLLTLYGLPEAKARLNALSDQQHAEKRKP